MSGGCMPIVETLRDLSEAWELFKGLPDDAILNVELSALYLCVSVKTLARYRQNVDGPAYIQYQAGNSKARNQRVNYLFSDLKAWRNSHKVVSSMQAAQVRGLAFTSLSDFTKLEPFWTIDNKIYSHSLTISDEVFSELFQSTRSEVIWISIEKVLFEDWCSARERQRWNDLFIEFFEELIEGCKAGQQKHIISSILN